MVNIIKSKRHLTKDGLREIVNIKASLNNKLTPELLTAFPDVNPVSRGVMDRLTNINPY